MVQQELSIELKAHLNKADLKVMESELKRLGSEKGIALKTNLAWLRTDLKTALNEVKKFRKAWNKNATVKAQFKVEWLKKQVNIANRALNNFVATWKTTSSRMWWFFKSIKTW